MALDGEAIIQEFILIGNNPIPDVQVVDIPEGRTRDCCGDFSLKVLADIGSTDPLKNDVSGFLWWFNPLVTGAVLKLYKFNDALGDFVFLANLNSTTYGTAYAYGFFVNDSNESFVGYQVEWKKVLTVNGAGGYMVKCEATLATGGTSTLESPMYCLKQYSAMLADGTVRIEYNINHILGISDNDLAIKDFGELNWYNSYRLRGFFGFPTSEYEQDYIQYDNGQRVAVEDEQEPEYILKLFPTPSFVHDIMRTDVLQGDSVLITDYNSKNAATFVRKAVIKNGGYSPDWKRMQSKLATVEVKFRQTFNNLKKLHC